MTIELSLLIAGVSVAFAAYFGITSKQRNDRKDTQKDAEERAATNTMVITKLENIGNDVKDIKRDYKETRKEVQDLHDRVVIVEQSMKAYHKRLDETNNNSN
jgi:peptidoglycan hydrolase CwlO-like protein